MRTHRPDSRRSRARVAGRDQEAAYDGLGGKTDLISICRNRLDQLRPLPDFCPMWRALGRPVAKAEMLGGVLRSRFRAEDATRP